MRLDNYLVEQGLCESRNKAQSIIKEGLVSIQGNVVRKVSHKIELHENVHVQEYEKYVSRSAKKLELFLNQVEINTKDITALDIGASTGGFTQVLLKHGAKKVFAVDVGSAQLHQSLREDKRVEVYENCDIRDFHSEIKFDLVVSDVSFISLLKILNDVQSLSAKDIILLFKPQFEVGKDAKRDANGVVLDKKAIDESMKKFESACETMQWTLVQKEPSKITGKEGNLEYCYYFRK